MSKSQPVFDAIKRRRVTRAFTEEPVGRGELEHLLRAARWAPSAGNRRIHKFVVIDDRPSIELVRSMDSLSACSWKGLTMWMASSCSRPCSRSSSLRE